MKLKDFLRKVKIFLAKIVFFVSYICFQKGEVAEWPIALVC